MDQISPFARRLAAIGLLPVALLLALAPAAAAQREAVVEEIADQIESRCYFADTDLTDVTIDELEALIARTDGDIGLVVLTDDADDTDLLAEDVRSALGEMTVLVVSESEIGADSSIYGSDVLNDAVDAALGQSDTGDLLETFVASLPGNDISGTCGPSSLAANTPATGSGSSGDSSGGGSNAGWWILGGGAVAMGGGIWYLKRKNEQEDEEDIDEARDEIRSQLAIVSSEIVDNEQQIQLAENSAATEHFRRASATYTDVSGKVDQTTNLIELAALNDQIELARWELEAAEAILDDRPVPPKPEPDKPKSCFFDPTHRHNMEECTVKTSDGDKEVMVCGACADKIEAGQQPQSRMIRVDGQRVPAAKAPRSHGGLGMGGLSIFEILLGTLGSGGLGGGQRRSRRRSGGIGPIDFGGGLPRRSPGGGVFGPDRTPQRRAPSRRSAPTRRTRNTGVRSKGRARGSRRR